MSVPSILDIIRCDRCGHMSVVVDVTRRTHPCQHPDCDPEHVDDIEIHDYD